ncbi:MAG: hypothetical protein AB7D05_08595 [Mangrovibacterium sp.]
MEENNNYRKIQEAIDSLPDNFSILEEQIDVDMQMEYFKQARDKRNNGKIEDLQNAEAMLCDPGMAPRGKKQLLVRLAGQDEVEAFRIIERFHKKTRGKLRKWAVLALQESRMILQSTLLGEQQVFISTGLGGKGQNIRYFIALIKKDKLSPFSAMQKKVIEDELNFFLEKEEGGLEQMHFDEELALGSFLFPLKKNLQEIFRSFIEECNQYGNFLNEDVIITNVKTLTAEEVRHFLQQQQKGQTPEF